jgi:hypothetical protein
MTSVKTVDPIKYLIIGDTNTSQLITEYVVLKSTQTQTEAKQIFDKLSKSQDKIIDQRNKIQGKQGNYYFTIFSPNLFYLALADASYQERFIFELFENIQKENISLMINEKKELNVHGKQILKSLVDKYQNENNVNRIATISSDVNDIKLDMNQNIKKMVNNLDDIRSLEDSSNRIKLGASDYKKNAKDLERVTWWKNCKLTIIIIAVIVAVALAIILPLCLK